jgi:hypothetical protein
MLLVIFGAGASFDSVPSRPPVQFPDILSRPPLANELFADRPRFIQAMRTFYKCQPIIPYLQQLIPGQTVESVLERLQSEAAERPERARQMAAVKWYLHSMLWDCERQWEEVANGITNYKTLLDQIESSRKYDERVCLVTFNYDTLLDKVMPTVGIHLTQISDYIRNDTYKLIKIHGSTNWAREVDSTLEDISKPNVLNFVHQLIDKTPEIKVSRRFRVVEDQPISKQGETYLFPAIAIPVETKTESHFECPDEHMAALKAFLPSVTKILVIGWRGMESHFVEILKQHFKSKVAIPVTVVAGNKQEAVEIGKRLNGAFPITSNAADSGFTQFVTRREGEAFLGT